jgi:hypothetical protein
VNHCESFEIEHESPNGFLAELLMRVIRLHLVAQAIELL